MPHINSLEDLECWKACRALRLFVVQQVIPLLPSEERFRLGDQLYRAARSTTSNIAEGFGRRHYLDNAKFIRNSLGSQHECLDHLIAATDEDLVPEGILDEFRQLFEKAVALSNGYAAYLGRSARG
ncbi:four helix bundle protein [Coraliomargarita parva]|uniref:four helix bundle protein n=1 Tax=Coraliomargarita parva TaxID=3014050 RepID=UPI0022B50562|nr:four helix bundle protein [Coraliomargarita parva]